MHLAGVSGIMAAMVATAVALGASFYDYDNRSESNHATESIRFGYFPVVGHAIPIVGMDRGIFQEYLPDVRIEPRLFDSGPQVVESMFAGSIDIAYVGPGPAINAFLNSEDGKKIRIISGAASGGTSFVMHPSATSPNFDFAGKRVAAPQIGNTQDVSLRHYLAEQNLRPADRGGSVTIYNIPNPDIVTLFVKGEIDGAWVSEPWATILEQEHNGTRLFYEEEMWPNKMFSTVLLIADTEYARQYPEIVQSWLDAHYKTAEVIENSNETAVGEIFNKFLLEKFGQQLDAKVATISAQNTKVTTDPLKETVYEFAQRADGLGYMGRGTHDLTGLFWDVEPVDAADGLDTESAGSTSKYDGLGAVLTRGIAQWRS